MNHNMRQDLLAAACGAPERREDGAVVQCFCLEEGFIGFAGHFPGYPIVPAVAQLLAAQLLIEQSSDGPLQLHTVSHAKFLQQLLPGVPFSVACRLKQEQPLCYDVRIQSGEELASTFKLVFVAREPKHG